MEQVKQTTGVLRGDIRLLHGESLLLFDPASDAYYKISEHIANIISYFTEDMPSFYALTVFLHFR